MKETSLFEKLIENTPLAILVIGVILLLIGAAGGWPSTGLQVGEWGWRIALGVMGVVTAGFGGLSYWRERTRAKSDGGKTHRNTDEDSHKTYDLKITSPFDGETVSEKFVVAGKYGVKPPNDVEVAVLEVSPRSGLYYPKTKGVDFNEETKTWRTKAAISIALRQFSGGQRKLLVATMRKDNALWEYFYHVGNAIRRNLNDQTIQIPGFRNLTPDIVKCHEITIKRKF